MTLLLVLSKAVIVTAVVTGDDELEVSVVNSATSEEMFSVANSPSFENVTFSTLLRVLLIDKKDFEVESIL